MPEAEKSGAWLKTEPRVLMIGADEDDAVRFSSAMLKKGLQVVHSRSAKEAFQYLVPEGSFNVIILDVNIPDADNGNTLGEFSVYAPGVPIVILTDVDDEEVMQHLLRRGASAYLVKDEVTPLHVYRAIKCAILKSCEQANADERFQEELVKLDRSIVSMKRNTTIESSG